MASKWLRASSRRPQTVSRRLKKAVVLHVEQLEPKVLPATNYLASIGPWSALRGFAGANVGASVTPASPALAAVWNGSSPVTGSVPEPTGLLPATSADATTPQGGHYRTPGDMATSWSTGPLATVLNDPSGSPVLTGAAGSVPYVLDPSGWSYRYDIYPGWSPSSLLNSGPGTGSSPGGPSSWDTTVTVTNPDGTLTTTVSQGSSSSSSTSSNSLDLSGPSSSETITSYTSFTSTTTTDTAGLVLFRSVETRSTSSDYQSSSTLSANGTSSFSYTLSASDQDSVTTYSQTTQHWVSGNVTEDNTITVNDAHASNQVWTETGGSSFSGLTASSSRQVTGHRTTQDTHAVSVQGTAALSDALGSTGAETYTYQENSADQVTDDEIGTGTGLSATSSSVYVGQHSAGASWDDSGTEDRFTPTAGSQRNELNHQFVYHAGFAETYALSGTSTNDTFAATTTGGGSASRSAADQGLATTATTATLDGEPGTQVTGETFTRGDTSTATTAVQLTRTRQGATGTVNSLAQTDVYGHTEAFLGQGTVTIAAAAASNSVGDIDQFTTQRSLTQELTVTLGGSGAALTWTADGSGSASSSQTDQAVETFQDVNGLGPQLHAGLANLGGAAGQFLTDQQASLGGTPSPASATGSGSLNWYEDNSTQYTVHQALRGTEASGGGAVAGGPGSLDHFVLDLQSDRTLGGTTTGLASVTAGSQMVPDRANEDFTLQGSGSDSIHDLYSAGSAGASLAVTETAADTFGNNQYGTETTDDVVQLGQGPGAAAGADPGNPAASTSLLAGDQMAEQTSTGTFQDTVGGSESATLTQLVVYQGQAGTLASLILDLDTQDNFNLQDAGTGTLAGTGPAGTDQEAGDYHQADQGNGTRHAHLSGDATGLTLTVADGLGDDFQATDHGTDQFDKTVAAGSPLATTLGLDPVPGSAAASLLSPGASDHLTGTDFFQTSVGGSEALTMHRLFQLASGTWTEQSVAATLTSSDQFTDADSGQASDAQTNSAGTDQVGATYQDGDTGTDQTQVQVTGTGTNWTVTEDDTGSDQFTDQQGGTDHFNQIVDPNSPLAAALGFTPVPSTVPGSSVVAGSLSDHLTGDDVFQVGVGGHEAFQLHRVWQVAGDTWTLGNLTADIHTDENTSEFAFGTASDTETGNGSTDQVSATYQDTVTGQDHTDLLVAGTGDNLTATADTTGSATFSDGQADSDNFDRTLDPTSPLGIALGLSPAPGAGPASSALTPGSVSDHLTGNDTVTLTRAGTDSFTLHQVGQLVAGTWTLTNTTADETADDTQDETDTGTVGDIETASTGTDQVNETYQDRTFRTDHTHLHAEGTGDNWTVTDDQTENDTFSDGQVGSDNFDHTVDPRSPQAAALGLTPLANNPSGSSGSLSDHLTGTDAFTRTLGGTASINRHQVWQGTAETWTLGATRADVTVDDTEHDTEIGTASDSETGAAGPNNLTETYQDSATSTAHTQLHAEGTGTNLTVTEDDSSSETFSASDVESGDISQTVDPNDPTAGAAGANLAPPGTGTTASAQLQGTLSLHAAESGSATVDLHSVWQEQNDTWTLTAESGDLVSTDNTSSSEVDDGSLQGIGTSAATGQDHATANFATTATSHLQVSGSGTNLTITEDDRVDDSSTSGDNGNEQDAGAAAAGTSGSGTGAAAQDGSFNGTAGSTDHQTSHDVYSFDGSTWTLVSATVDASGGDTYHESDAGHQPSSAGATAAPASFSDSADGADSIREHTTASGTTVSVARDESSTQQFGDAQSAGGPLAPADALRASATFTLHRDLGGDPEALALCSATLDVDGSFTDAATGPATFHLHVSGGPTSFTTTITQTGTGLFTQLIVTVTAGDTWLDDFINQMDTLIQGRLGASGTGWGAVAPSQAINAVSLEGSSGNVTTTQTANGVVHVTTVDSQGHVLFEQVTDQASGTVLSARSATFDPQGQQLTATDGLGRTTAWTYDAAGHKTSETVAAGTPQVATTTYVWQGDNRVQVIDPDGNITSYGYDDQGRQVSMTDPLGHTETQSYNAQGQVASVTNRDGQRRDFSYDGAGRETGETWYAADGTVEDTLTFTYNGDGTLASAANNAGTYQFGYDDQGRLIHVDEPFGVSLDFAYDAQGHRTLVSDSFGGTTQSRYDAAQQLVSRLLTAPGQPTLRIDLGYDDNGNLVQETRSSDAAGTQVVGTSSYAYGPTGQVSVIQHTDGAGNVIGAYTYSYDASGDVTGEVDTTGSVGYQYDATGQLTQSGMSVYGYDANGNRSNQGYVIGPDNQVLSDGLWVYAYDGEGNEVQKVNSQTGVVWHYTFDARNQLVSAEEDTGVGGTILVQVDYRYDVFGNRLEKDVLLVGATVPVVTRYAYDGWNPAKGTPVGTENFDVWAELDGNSSLTTRYLRGDVVDQIFARLGQDGTVAWLDTDRLGSVRAVTDGSGVLLDQIAYDAFGNITSESNPAAGGVYLWTGREFDAETGLQYNRARFYDPSLGRWINQDPLGLGAGDSNLYRYVFNQPTEKTDPTGEVVFLVHGIRDDGSDWFPGLTQQLVNAWNNPVVFKDQVAMGNRVILQQVIPFHYEGVVRKTFRNAFAEMARMDNAMLKAVGKGGKALMGHIKEQTTILAASNNLAKPTPAVLAAANKLADQINAFRKANPNQPVNVIGHSNGTMVALLAAKRAKIDNLLLLNSPLNVKNRNNIATVRALLKNGQIGRLMTLYSTNDLVTLVVGGARSWGIPQDGKTFFERDVSNAARGLRVKMLKRDFITVYGPLGRKWKFPAPTFATVEIPTISAHGYLVNPTQAQQYIAWVYARFTAWVVKK